MHRVSPPAGAAGVFRGRVSSACFLSQPDRAIRSNRVVSKVFRYWLSRGADSVPGTWWGLGIGEEAVINAICRPGKVSYRYIAEEVLCNATRKEEAHRSWVLVCSNTATMYEIADVVLTRPKLYGYGSSPHSTAKPGSNRRLGRVELAGG